MVLFPLYFSERRENMEKRKKLYQALDIISVVAGCVFIGCKAGRALMRKYIKEARRVEK
jgi:hypothetical protein